MKTGTQEIKRAIETLELRANGLDHISGASARAVNIRVRPRQNKVIADLILVTDAEGGVSERYDNSEYDLNGIKRAIKKMAQQ